MDDTRERVPPQQLEAERATIGAMLIDHEALLAVAPLIRAHDFYRAAHQKIYQALLALADRSESVDLITITEELKTRGELDLVGGVGYVSSLTSTVPSTANVQYYAKIVKDASIRRQLIQVANHIIANAMDETRETRVVVEESEQRIFEMTDQHQVGSFRQARDIVKETIDTIERFYKTKDSYTGIPSGFPALDTYLSGFQNSELIIVGARPSIGKTTFALNIAANIAIHQHIPVGFFTLEMSSLQLMLRLLASEARISNQAIRTGMLKPANFAEIGDAAALIYEAPLYIADTPSMRLLDLRAQARRMRMQHGVQIIFVDYITLVTAERAEIPRHEQIAEISRSLKALARELNVPVVALSQVTRDTEGRVPTLANIRESGSIEQDADVVLFLHREREATKSESEGRTVIPTDVVIAKQRNGPVGTIPLAFLPSLTRFDSLAEDVQ